MCGFMSRLGNSQSSKSEFNSLLKLSSSRGPDMVGYYNNYDIKKDEDPFIQFGFNRLSILDLSENANQPIISKSKRYVVMCNGEITNYLKLKSEMGLKPKDLRTNSDTEVLCHAFDHYGIRGVVNRINGMYAIVIYDLIEHIIYLIRDPAGIKPLYFAQTKFGWILHHNIIKFLNIFGSNQIYKLIWSL